MNNMNWTELKSFFLVAKHGSHSAAARVEDMSQPTLSRHVSRLEERLGHRLLERTVSGVSLTEAGSKLYEQVASMASEAAKILPGDDPDEKGLKGTVRLTSSRIVANYLLPNILVELALEEPGIEIELASSDRTENLHYREADIAIRMYRPQQPDVIVRKITELEIGIYASGDYLKRNRVPANLEDFFDHDFVGYDRSTLIIDGFRRMGFDINREFFKYRCDDQVACWEMVIAGLGIGFNQRIIGDKEDRVKRIHLPIEIPPMSVWLTAHAAVKSDPKIRRVYDFLANKLGDLNPGQ